MSENRPTKLQKKIIAKQIEMEDKYRQLFIDLEKADAPRWIKDRAIRAVYKERHEVIDSYNTALRVISEVSK